MTLIPKTIGHICGPWAIWVPHMSCIQCTVLDSISCLQACRNTHTSTHSLARATLWCFLLFLSFVQLTPQCRNFNPQCLRTIAHHNLTFFLLFSNRTMYIGSGRCIHTYTHTDTPTGPHRNQNQKTKRLSGSDA